MIYQNEGITCTKIINRLTNLAPSTIKRHVCDLKKTHHVTDKRLGLDLIREEHDPNDGRLKHLYVNENGIKVCEELIKGVGLPITIGCLFCAYSVWVGNGAGLNFYSFPNLIFALPIEFTFLADQFIEVTV